jgi:hypothetical protein
MKSGSFRQDLYRLKIVADHAAFETVRRIFSARELLIARYSQKCGRRIRDCAQSPSLPDALHLAGQRARAGKCD